jgi:hypothetical protein
MPCAKPALEWDTIVPGPGFGTGTGHRITIEVGLTLESAQAAGIPLETELYLETTAEAARGIAAQLVAKADLAEKLNRDENLPVQSQVTLRDAD